MKPCNDCPFLSEHDGRKPILLGKPRRKEIAKALRAGGSFPCHKTIDYSDEDDEGGGRVTAKSKFCAGALATMDNDGMDESKNGCMANQAVRIYSRLGGCNPDKVEGRDQVFSSLADWIKNARSI